MMQAVYHLDYLLSILSLRFVKCDIGLSFEMEAIWSPDTSVQSTSMSVIPLHAHLKVNVYATRGGHKNCFPINTTFAPY
jgi:hypothetical protein